MIDKKTKTNIIGKIFGWYKKKALVMVEDKQHKVEEHAFDIDETGRLVIYPRTSEKYYENPTIEGENFCFDSNSNSIMLRLREGEKFAIPLFEKVSSLNKRITSEDDDRLISLGRALEQYENPQKPRNNELNNLYLAIGICLLGNVGTLYAVMKVCDKLGVALF